MIPAGEMETAKSLELIGQPRLADLLKSRPLRDPVSKRESTKIMVLYAYSVHTRTYIHTLNSSVLDVYSMYGTGTL